MQPQFQPLEGDVRWKNLVYLSEAKLDQFCLSTEKRGWNLSLKIGGGVTARKKSLRERLGEVDRLLQSQSLIHYEIEPEPGAYFLVRLIASAGTYWPWAGNVEPMKHVAWWVGQGGLVKVNTLMFLRMGTSKICSSRELCRTLALRVRGGHLGVILTKDLRKAW